MTEQEQLWYELEHAMPRRKKPKEENKPNQCSFCHKKTGNLSKETVGGITIYLCETCMEIMKQSRKKLDEE